MIDDTCGLADVPRRAASMLEELKVGVLSEVGISGLDRCESQLADALGQMTGSFQAGVAIADRGQLLREGLEAGSEAGRLAFAGEAEAAQQLKELSAAKLEQAVASGLSAADREARAAEFRGGDRRVAGTVTGGRPRAGPRPTSARRLTRSPPRSCAAWPTGWTRSGRTCSATSGRSRT